MCIHDSSLQTIKEVPTSRISLRQPTTPSLGILGFDLGSYIISTLANEGSFATSQKYFDGVQMDIELQRSSNWSGYINKCVELVHFNGSKATESIIK